MHCKIENLEPNFDFLIYTFLLLLFYWSRRRFFQFSVFFREKNSQKSPNQKIKKSTPNFLSANIPYLKRRKPRVNILKTQGDRF